MSARKRTGFRQGQRVYVAVSTRCARPALYLRLTKLMCRGCWVRFGDGREEPVDLSRVFRCREDALNMVVEQEADEP